MTCSVSMIIPPELLPVLSAHLTLPRKPFPVMFEIPPIYTLDRMTACSQVPPYPLPPISTMPPPMYNIHTHRQLAHLRNRSSVSEALQAAINSGIAAAAAANGGRIAAPAPRTRYPWTDRAFVLPKNERAYSAPPTTVISVEDNINCNDETKGFSR